jgi:ubiquitin C-terminal hydrolase
VALGEGCYEMTESWEDEGANSPRTLKMSIGEIQILRTLVDGGTDIIPIFKYIQTIDFTKTRDTSKNILPVAIEFCKRTKGTPQVVGKTLLWQMRKWPDLIGEIEINGTPIDQIRLGTVLVNTRRDLGLSTNETVQLLKVQSSQILTGLNSDGQNIRFDLLEPLISMFKAVPETMVKPEETCMILIRYLIHQNNFPNASLPTIITDVLNLLQKHGSSIYVQTALAGRILLRLIQGHACSNICAKYLATINTSNIRNLVAETVGAPEMRYTDAFSQLLQWISSPLSHGIGPFICQVIHGLQDGNRGKDVLTATRMHFSTLLSMTSRQDVIDILKVLFEYHLPRLLDFKVDGEWKLCNDFKDADLLRFFWIYTLAHPTAVDVKAICRSIPVQNVSEQEVEEQKKLWDSLQMDLVPFVKRNRAGLRNLGNTCFMNAMIQSLYSSSFLSKILSVNSGSELLMAFAKVFAMMYAGKESVVSPKLFLEKCPQWLKQGHQHDSGEFLKFLIEEFETTGVLDPFKGKIANVVVCQVCFSKSVRVEEMYDLVLPFSSFDGEKRVKRDVTLESMFDSVFVEEEMVGDNLYACDTCKCNQPAKKRVELVQAANVLILVLGRFSYSVSEGVKRKVSTLVDFPEELMVQEEDGIVRYVISSVIYHVGQTLERGHYYQQSKVDDGWIECNDETVRVTTTKNREPYIFFYQRFDADNRKVEMSRSMMDFLASKVSSEKEKSEVKVEVKVEERDEDILEDAGASSRLGTFGRWTF